MSWVKQEQDSLVETFRTTDPDAPTLCEGWNVGRLLAHLTQREHSLVARIVDSVARKPPGQEPGLNKLTSQARTPQGYDALIDRFTQGAPRWSPMSWAADRLNFVEYLIHHEDIRRAQPGWRRRHLSDESLDTLWQGLKAQGATLVRPAGVPVVVRRTDSGETATLASGDDPVELSGPVTEIVFYLFGRDQVRDLAFAGPDDKVAKVRRADFGF